MFKSSRKTFQSKGDGEKFSFHIMRIFDSDGNGFLDFKEFIMAIDIASCQTEESKLAWAFKLYDLVWMGEIFFWKKVIDLWLFFLKDNDGVIDLQEMANVIETLESLDNSTSCNSSRGKFLPYICQTLFSYCASCNFCLGKVGLSDDFDDSNAEIQVIGVKRTISCVNIPHKKYLSDFPPGTCSNSIFCSWHWFEWDSYFRWFCKRIYGKICANGKTGTFSLIHIIAFSWKLHSNRFSIFRESWISNQLKFMKSVHTLKWWSMTRPEHTSDPG